MLRHVMIAILLMLVTNSKHRLDDRVYIKAARDKEIQQEWDDVNRKAAQIGWPLWCDK